MKAVPDYFPNWIARVTVAKKGGSVTHALANDAATLVYLAGQSPRAMTHELQVTPALDQWVP